MPKCSICGKELKNPNSKSHIKSKFHEAALLKKKSSSNTIKSTTESHIKSKTHQPVLLKKKSSSSTIKGPNLSSDIQYPKEMISKLAKTLNQLIKYNEEKFNQIDQRLKNIEDSIGVKRDRKIARKKIEINSKLLLTIIKNLSKQKKGDYITFLELRRYIAQNYIVNYDWENYLENLRNMGKIEFSKGAKSDNKDIGYKDKFNTIYYYFKLL